MNNSDFSVTESSTWEDLETADGLFFNVEIIWENLKKEKT